MFEKRKCVLGWWESISYVHQSTQPQGADGLRFREAGIVAIKKLPSIQTVTALLRNGPRDCKSRRRQRRGGLTAVQRRANNIVLYPARSKGP